MPVQQAAARARSPRHGVGIEMLIRRLMLLAPLEPHEVALIRSLDAKPKKHLPETTICPRDDGSPFPRLIVSGWACRPRILLSGKRQMLSILLPGDLLGDRGVGRPLALSPAVAITAVGTIGVGPLFGAVAEYPDRYPNLANALTQSDRMEEQQLIEHVVRLGCRTAIQRFAHYLLELHQRLSRIGFIHDGSFPMPLTQEALADLLGLSLVHVNRLVSRLKRERLVEIRRGVVHISDFAKLALLADEPSPIAA